MTRLCKGARKLPSKHISIRVPWHDTGWSGTICNQPRSNASCLVLPRIHENKDERQEEELSGQHFSKLDKKHLPPCITERAGFMSPAPYRYYINHPYHWNGTHSHFEETALDVPGYAAACMPFAWLLREKAEDKVEQLDLQYDQESESKVHKALHPYGKTWVQDRENQRVLTDTFFGAVAPNHSLCFFYAKRTPLSDEASKTILGVGVVTDVGKAHEYNYSGEGSSTLLSGSVPYRIRSGLTESTASFFLTSRFWSLRKRMTQSIPATAWRLRPTRLGMNSRTVRSMSRTTRPSRHFSLAYVRSTGYRKR